MLNVIEIILDIILTAYICHAVNDALHYNDKKPYQKRKA